MVIWKKLNSNEYTWKLFLKKPIVLYLSSYFQTWYFEDPIDITLIKLWGQDVFNNRKFVLELDAIGMCCFGPKVFNLNWFFHWNVILYLVHLVKKINLSYTVVHLHLTYFWAIRIHFLLIFDSIILYTMCCSVNCSNALGLLICVNFIKLYSYRHNKSLLNMMAVFCVFHFTLCLL